MGHLNEAPVEIIARLQGEMRGQAQEIGRLKGMLERLRGCQHACVGPCPHKRHFEAVTGDALPPRRVTPREASDPIYGRR